MFKDSPAFSSFSTNDLEKTKEFYGRLLGLELDQQKSGPMEMVMLKLASGGSVLIYPKDDHQPATFTVLNFPVDDVEKTVDELTAKGVMFEHYDNPMIKTDEKGIARGMGPMMAWFKDPAGNVLAIMQKM